MNEIQREAMNSIRKNAIKDSLKQLMSTPNDTFERRCEINRIVEQAAQSADFIETTAKLCSMDLNQFLNILFGLSQF